MTESVTSRRELIIAEIWKRIAKVFPESTIQRGVFEGNTDTYDKFYILDMPESCDLSDKHRGMYHCAFPVSISYFLQVAEEDIYSVGNMLLEKVRLSIETDERLSGLVVSYHMDEGALIWYDKGVLDVELLFIVEYVKDAGWVNNPFNKP